MIGSRRAGRCSPPQHPGTLRASERHAVPTPQCARIRLRLPLSCLFAFYPKCTDRCEFGVKFLISLLSTIWFSSYHLSVRSNYPERPGQLSGSGRAHCSWGAVRCTIIVQRAGPQGRGRQRCSHRDTWRSVRAAAPPPRPAAPAGCRGCRQ